MRIKQAVHIAQRSGGPTVSKKGAIGTLAILAITVGVAAYAVLNFVSESPTPAEHERMRQIGTPATELGGAAAAASAAERAAEYARNAEAHKSDAHESAHSSTLRSLTTPRNIQLGTAHAERAAIYAGVTADLAKIASRAAEAAEAAARSGNAEAAEVCAEAAEAVAKSAREQALLTARTREITHSYMTEYLDGIDEIMREAENHGDRATEHFSSGKARLEQCLSVETVGAVPDITW